MKSKLLIFLFSLFVSAVGMGQIRNGSFEQNTGMPTSVGQYYLVMNWGNCNSNTATPDYYHLNGINGGDLPTTPAAILNPIVGSAVMGLSVYNNNQPNEREYISTKLSSPLEVGETYILNFKLTNGVIPKSSNAGYAISDFGILFTTSELFQNDNDPILETPQFEIDTVFYSREWQNISFRITPTTPLEYMTIGVFKNDDAIAKEKVETNAKVAYYFIDNFRIRNQNDPFVGKDDPTVAPQVPNDQEPDDQSNEIQPYYIPNSFTPNNDQENDYFTPIINTDEDFVFEVYSHWGELLFRTTEKNIGWDGTYKSKPMPQEVYVWTLRYTTIEGEKKVNKQFHGQVNLIR